MSETSDQNDSQSAIERLRLRIDVLEKRLWDLEIAVETLGSDSPPAADEPDVDADSSGTMTPETTPVVPVAAPGSAPTPTDSSPPTETLPVHKTTRLPEAAKQAFEVLDVDARPAGESEQGFDYVWQITVQSHSDSHHKLRATVRFVDLHSQAVDEVESPGLMLFAGRRQKFTGKHTIGAAAQDDVVGVKAIVEMQEESDT